MTEKIQELLAVRGMPELEQSYWLYNHKIGKKSCNYQEWQINNPLADLAFRLRDEVVKLYPQGWRSAKYEVGNKAWGNYHDYTWDEEARPIDWIIAALIAKELSKEWLSQGRLRKPAR